MNSFAVGSLIPKRLQRFLDPDILSGVAVAGAMTIGVKAVAFWKEIVVAHRFGTSDHVDTYLVAMLIPSLVALAVGSASRDALVPAYVERRLDDGEGASRLVSNTLWSCAGLLFVAALLTLLLVEPLMGLLAGGFAAEKRAMGGELLVLLLPYMLCVGLATLLRGYLQAHRRFALAASTPALIPLGVVAVLLVMPGEPRGQWLAVGTSLGAVVLLAVVLVATRSEARGRLLRRPSWDAPTSSVLGGAVPLLAGVAILEIYFVVDTMMAAILPAGSVAVLTYGERISGVFCIVGAAVVQALFPHVSELAARGAWRSLGRTVLGFSALVLACTAPFVLLFWLAAEPVVGLVFERGEFTAADTANVAEVLRFGGLQIPGSILMALGARVVMALGTNRLVPVVALCGLVLNVAVNLLFMRWFGVKGIALATALVNVFSAGMFYLYAGLRLRKLIDQPAER